MNQHDPANIEGFFMDLQRGHLSPERVADGMSTLAELEILARPRYPSSGPTAFVLVEQSFRYTLPLSLQWGERVTVTVDGFAYPSGEPLRRFPDLGATDFNNSPGLHRDHERLILLKAPAGRPPFQLGPHEVVIQADIVLREPARDRVVFRQAHSFRRAIEVTADPPEALVQAIHDPQVIPAMELSIQMRQPDPHGPTLLVIASKRPVAVALAYQVLVTRADGTPAGEAELVVPEGTRVSAELAVSVPEDADGRRRARVVLAPSAALALLDNARITQYLHVDIEAEVTLP
jgi:hypothetical protein